MQENVNKLIKDNEGLVYKQLHRFKLVDNPDAESVAFEALYKAICDYDEAKGTALSTLATVYIYNALGGLIRTLNKKRQLEVISYNSITRIGDKEHELLDHIPSESNVEKDMLRREANINIRRIINEAHAKLTNDTHRNIVGLWIESEYLATTKDIAKQVGVSQSYASQVINNFKASLKKPLEEFYYD